MKYKGVIIEESLTDKTIINELNVIQKDIEKVDESCETPWLDIWTVTTVLIDEDKIDKIVKRLSNLLETAHDSNWYCDFKNAEYHFVVFPKKIFKIKRSNKEEYRQMREYGLSIGISKLQLPNFDDLPENLLIGFLIYAKKNTYASGNALQSSPSKKGSIDFIFSEQIEGEKMTYHDSYFGGTNFIGQEVVYRKDEKPKWGMNYYGKTFDDNLSEEVMDKVLRPALSKVGEDKSVLPLRGPSLYKNDSWEYRFSSKGDIASFTGLEQIYKDGTLVFELQLHGGYIK